MSFVLKEGERLDDLQISNLQIIQSPDKFCFGIDAVLLSGFVHAGKAKRLLDLGTGTGILPLLLYAKTEIKEFVALEIQRESADMARRSVLGNKISEEGERRIQIIEGDLRTASERFGKSGFDIVTSNPPYMIAEHGIQNPKAPKQIARHEIFCSFEDVAREASLVLKPNGRLFLVHRPFRLVELFTSLVKYKLEPKRMRFVHPTRGKEPSIVLIEAVKYGKSRITIEPPLMIYEENGEYSEEIKRDYSF